MLKQRRKQYSHDRLYVYAYGVCSPEQNRTATCLGGSIPTVYINRGESVNIMSTLSGKRQFLCVVKSIKRDRFQKKKEIKFFSYFCR